MRKDQTRVEAGVRRGVFLPLLLLLLLLSGCAGSAPQRKGGDYRELQWPPLPVPPRITWVKEIRDFHDVGISKGFWQRAAELLTGEPDPRIGKPYGVFVDAKERLFIADVGLAVVHVMDLEKKKYSVIGGSNPALRTPIAVTGDDKDNIYITDAGAGTIYRYPLSGGSLQPFNVTPLDRPTGIAFNPNNRLIYVSDTVSHQVVVFDLSGNERYRIGGRGTSPGQFNYPTDLFVDAAGRLYVTDALNSRIQIFTASGTLLKYFGRAGDTVGNFARPKGVAVDSDGHIYVCDALFDAVQIFNDTGRVLLDFGTHGSNPGQFWMPAGIFIGKGDLIYVADSYNRRVQVFRYLKVDDPQQGAPAKAPGERK